jgi:FkbM family methyltransferase
MRQVGCRVETIFDVGANVGQSAIKFRSAFPSARIYCFEPVKSTFTDLLQKVGDDNLTSCFPLAMGRERARQNIYHTQHSTTNSLIKPELSLGEEAVEVDTVDDFSRDNHIDRIDLLKIDTEGFDLEVLHGAKYMLNSDKIAFVLIEVGFHPFDARHVLFDHARDFLVSNGFRLFGIYDQTLEWSGEPNVRFANACFINTDAFHVLPDKSKAA